MKNAAPTEALETTRDDERPSGVPKANGHGVEAEIGAGVGMLAGAAAGAVVGPIGLVVGAALGGVVGEVTGQIMHEHDARRSKHDRELDDAIGVTSGPVGAGAPVAFVAPPKAMTFLRADHDLLESLAAGIVKAVEESDREDLPRLVTALEEALVDHLDQEERELVSDYAREHPDEAAAIRREHDAIRAAVTELGVEMDLHVLRADAIAALVTRLREHAAHENATMYAWAARAAPAR